MNDAPTPAPSFRSSKGKTIALVVGAMVVIGALGAAAAALAGGEHSPQQRAATPGGSGILNPTPIGNLDGGTDAPEPQPSPDGEPVPSGDGIVIGGIATIPVPAGWAIAGESDIDLLLEDGNNSWVYATTGVEDPSADAGALLSDIVPAILPAENYSQLETSAVTPVQPFGSLVSVATMEYQAMWVDAQGIMPVAGVIYIAVRQDGSTLVMSAEHTPPEDLAASEASWGPLIDDAFNLFGSI